MKTRTLLTSILAAGIAASALAGDLIARAGRWETTGEIQYGPKRPRGMPATDTYTEIDCISKAFETEAKFPLPLPDESCKVANYRKEGGSVKFTFACEEANFEFALTPHGPDAYSGTLVVKGKDPSVNYSATFRSKRTAARCSAQELEEHGGE